MTETNHPAPVNRDKPNRVGYRISEWSEMTGTSRITTWRAIRDGKLKAVDYCGIKLIPDSERARLVERGDERSAYAHPQIDHALPNLETATSFFDPLPAHSYDVIVIDPPWPFATWSSAGQAKSASKHYRVMTLADIMALPVRQLLKDHAVVLLWTTGAMLEQAHDASRVTLRGSRSLIAFDVPPFSFTARLIDSSFPAYESIIPPPTQNSVRCDRLDLLAALSRLSAAAPSNDTALVALSWGNGRCLDLHLARSPLDGADVVAAEVHGSAEVALSLPQFASLLKEFSGEHVLLETANEPPVVIRGAGEKLALMVCSKWNFGSREGRT